ncbi:protoporphyrinogen/coproporphyrinogen oxidase [Myceligenerans crystallogenes]|uniref:Amine oxidase domain-containing protein n=1 Tax=Myceligenerans crystallogenes TaxID=316335 RepID=A0ABP4ZN89_9MICO
MTVEAVVVGGGIGGLVAGWELAGRGLDVVVLEAGERPGGPVRGGAFSSLPGVPLDLGAESFAVRGGVVERLAGELGLPVEPPAGLGAWGYAAGRAFPLPAAGILGIPSRPWAADVRRAVGWPGVLRGSLDRLLPRRFTSFDDVGALVRSRMGGRITDRLVAAVAAGVHSAPLGRLDVDAVAPGLRRAFEETGSLSRAVARLRAAAPPGSAVKGIDGGVHALVTALAGRLDVRTGHRVTGIERLGDEWRVATERGEFRGSRLVVATAAAAGLLEIGGAPVPERGADIWLATLLLDAPELDAAPRGTGMLVAATDEPAGRRRTSGEASGDDRRHASGEIRPAGRRRAGDEARGDDRRHPSGEAWPAGRRRAVVRAKALTHASAKWPWLARRLRDAAGPGTHVVRLSYGRIGEATAEPTREEAIQDASALLGVDLTGRARDFLTQHWDGSLPPPTPAYRARVREFTERAGAIPGLAVTGGWIAGTGLAAVVAHARQAAAQLP